MLVHLLIKLCQQLIEPARQTLRIRGLTQTGKIIAGHPAEQLVILQRRFHDRGEIAQQGVALFIAEQIVEIFKLFDIAVPNRAAAFDQRRHLLLERSKIAVSRQRILIRQRLQRSLVRLHAAALPAHQH